MKKNPRHTTNGETHRVAGTDYIVMNNGEWRRINTIERRNEKERH